LNFPNFWANDKNFTLEEIQSLDIFDHHQERILDMLTAQKETFIH